jgi:hypothetical protein
LIAGQAPLGQAAARTPITKAHCRIFFGGDAVLPQFCVLKAQTLPILAE